jgi:alkanesulfonate monooxygenase SsuD/methylene tetrahydromethanopterin reductase-like flavin-dependent oxidoreductase (luciferase family)
MRFGIVGPATPALIAQCETAEALGFEAAWLFDSHMILSDVYVIMALCAERTRRMCFGTGIAVAPSRIAPVTAHSIATLNQLYPGRVALGLGTGNTGRRTMGFPPMKARDFRDYVRTVKGLLHGETVEYREGDLVRPIRFLHPDQGIVNLDGPIPIYVAAAGRQTMRIAAELGDGLISFGASPDDIRAARAALVEGAQRLGRNLTAEGFRIILFHHVYVLNTGERADSIAARMAVGPAICALLRYLIHAGGSGGDLLPPLARGLERFRGWMQRHDIDPDRDYTRFYEHYMLRLPQEHVELLDEELIRTMAIVGEPEECLERIRALADAGVTDFGLNLGGNAHELMQRFSRAVIAAWKSSRAAPAVRTA